MGRLRVFFAYTAIGITGGALALLPLIQTRFLQRAADIQHIHSQFAQAISATQRTVSTRLSALLHQGTVTEALRAQQRYAVEKGVSEEMVPGEMDRVGVFTEDCRPFLSGQIPCATLPGGAFSWELSEAGVPILREKQKVEWPGGKGWLVAQVELGPKWELSQGSWISRMREHHWHIGANQGEETQFLPIGDGTLGLWGTLSFWDQVALAWTRGGIAEPLVALLFLIFLYALGKMGQVTRTERNQQQRLSEHFFSWCFSLEKNPSAPWRWPQDIRAWSSDSKKEAEKAAQAILSAMQLNHQNIGALIERCSTLHKELSQTKASLEASRQEKRFEPQHAALSHQIETYALPLLEKITTYEKTSQQLQVGLQRVMLEQAEPLSTLVSNWNQGIRKHGARKFFRHLDESKVEGTSVSLLEDQIASLQRSSSQLMKTVSHFLLARDKGSPCAKLACEVLTHWHSLATTQKIHIPEAPVPLPQSLDMLVALIEHRQGTHRIQVVNHAGDSTPLPLVPSTLWISALLYAMEAMMVLGKPEGTVSILVNGKTGAEKQHLLFSLMDYQLLTEKERQKKVEPLLAQANILLAAFGVQCHLVNTVSGMCSIAFSWVKTQSLSFVPPTVGSPQIEISSPL